MTTEYDVTIVGGGPVGIFAAFYCGLHRLKTQLIEALPTLGGQPANLYMDKPIWDVAGKAGTVGAGLINDLKDQLRLVPVDQICGEKVTNVIKDQAQRFTVVTTQRTTISKAIIIAFGNGAFAPRKLDLPAAKKLEGKQVQYFITNKSYFVNQRVAVLGGGDAAIDLALMLEPIAKEVYLVHRRVQFRALELAVQQLIDSSVKCWTPYLTKDLVQNADKSVTLILKKRLDSEEVCLTVDKILVNYGFIANNSALGGWTLNLAQEHGKITVDSTMETSVAGVYAIGDCATYLGKTPLIATGFGEATLAITNLAKVLYPNQRMATHSSSMKINPR